MPLALPALRPLSLATSPPPPPRLSQRFRTGQRVRARVLGFRPMDGLAVLSLKPSVVDQSILSAAGAPGGRQRPLPSPLPLCACVWVWVGGGACLCGRQAVGAWHALRPPSLRPARRCPAPDLHPGMPVTGTVSRVDEQHGVFVALTSSLK